MEASIIEANAQNIQQLVEASQSRPVVLNFFSRQAPECDPTNARLTQLANERQGQFVLANVDCDAQMELAQYFRIQALPTVLVLNQGQTVDGFAGPQPDAMVDQLLEKYLPKLWQLKLEQAQQLMAQQQFAEALPLLREAQTEEDNGPVKLALAETYLQLGRASDAEPLLATVALADQDGQYTSLMAQLELALEAADTPEIRALQAKLDANPDDVNAVVALAVAYNQAGRQEEALSALFVILKRDLSVADGEARKVFMDIVNALGQGDPIANQYRKKLYSLLY
ncbi:tetratricopeptide repeat protein [Ferrimonas sp. SCSIO 43195]|uniref:co-chaperone YbbN n=1 Tax=Ferrimonas sp. SCSIO 43195 TaxID=2822844 RepID=UPI0020762BBC|nr:tetratricopeptide repeat protein [Ferrimonas sp. SCSIO 43195]USD38708.1 tetratricopeptide repeat protein [Ferrimonas sp. SCSIO 43195]